jgi:hypothetical protein
MKENSRGEIGSKLVVVDLKRHAEGLLAQPARDLEPLLRAATRCARAPQLGLEQRQDVAEPKISRTASEIAVEFRGYPRVGYVASKGYILRQRPLLGGVVLFARTWRQPTSVALAREVLHPFGGEQIRNIAAGKLVEPPRTGLDDPNDVANIVGHKRSGTPGPVDLEHDLRPFLGAPRPHLVGIEMSRSSARLDAGGLKPAFQLNQERPKKMRGSRDKDRYAPDVGHSSTTLMPERSGRDKAKWLDLPRLLRKETI